MDYLEKLAANPHYKMTSKQLKELEERRRSRPVRHDPRIPKHNPAVPKHKTLPEKENEPTAN